MGNSKAKLGKKGNAKDGPSSKRSKKPASSPSESSDPNVELLLNKGPISSYYQVDYDTVLGRGHYAVVNLGVDLKTGLKVAVKRIQISKSRLESLKREVDVLRKVGKHPNIVTLYDIFITETELILVLELLLGGELFDRMVERGPYSEREASHHIRKIGLALKYLHRQGIVHRDLKPENLILTHKGENSELKIADFGLANIVDNTENATMKTVCGTWAYCAPEVKTTMSEDGGSACYTAKVDLWSVGVILFVILGAYHPFDADGDATDAQLWSNICSGKFDFNDPAWDHISHSAKDLIRNLIVVDPAKRYGTDELLSHPWIRQAASVPATPITPNINKSLTDYNDKRRSRSSFIGKLKGMNPLASQNNHQHNNNQNNSNTESSVSSLGTQQITEQDLIEQKRMLHEQKIAETKQQYQMVHYQQQQQLKQKQEHDEQLLRHYQQQQLMQAGQADQQQLSMLSQKFQQELHQLQAMFHKEQQQLLNQQQAELHQALDHIRAQDYGGETNENQQTHQRTSVRFADEITVETNHNGLDSSPCQTPSTIATMDASQLSPDLASEQSFQNQQENDVMTDAEEPSPPPLPKLTLNTLLPNGDKAPANGSETPNENHMELETPHT